MQEESAIRQIVDFLTKNSVDEYVKLPQIAVMGDTSSGKSSLLSAISSIQFPASDQLTTRCPTRLCMERSKTGSYWAKIEVQWHHSSSYKEKPRYESPVLQGEESFAQIPHYISEAQKYIIDISQKEVAFDVINVRISDPKAFDLTLIDLPGFVRSVGKDESVDIIGDIQTLCREYLDNERCIILAIIPANVDFHNAQIMADALKVDPTTKRTIPVITKPDLIDEGAEKGVFDLLQGKKTHDFQLGFHITKCRGQKALDQGMTVEQGLKSEETFFRSVDPWRSCSEMRDQFGVTNLKKKLASLQVEMLKETVPTIIKEIKGKKENAKDTLQKLGKDLSSDSNRRDVFSSVIQSFQNLVTGNLGGGKSATWKDKNDFSLRALFEEEKIDFGNKILRSKLNNIDKVPAKNDTVRVITPKGEVVGKVIKIRKDTYYVHPNRIEDADYFYSGKRETVEVSQKFDPEEITTVNDLPCKILTCSPSSNGRYRYMITYHSFKPFDKGSVQVDNSPWLLEEIRKCRGPDLPVFLNFNLFSSIAGKLIADEWKRDANTLLTNTFHLIESFIQHVLKISTLGTTAEFTHWMQSVMNSLIGDLKERTTSQVLNVLECEIEMPYTQNHYLFENISKKRNERMVEMVKKMANDGNVALDAILALFKANEEMSCDEHVVKEMEIVLTAYGKVAAKRMIDVIPMTIEREFIAALEKKISTCFKRTDSQLATLLKETNAVIHQRKKLLDMINNLENAERHIESLLGMR